MVGAMDRLGQVGSTATKSCRFAALFCAALVWGCSSSDPDGVQDTTSGSSAKGKGAGAGQGNSGRGESAEDSKGSVGSRDSGNEKDPGQSDEGDNEDASGAPKFDLGGIPDPKKPDGDDCECEKNADLIFLWDDSSNLWLYNPMKTGEEAFERLGKPKCPTKPGQYSFSMAVDRGSNAWLLVQPSGAMYKVDTLNEMKCVDSGHKPGTLDFTLFGMAYVEHPKDDRCEQLYMHSLESDELEEGPNIGKLGTLDPENMKVSMVGRINYSGGELTGTADGRLFAFSGAPGRLVEYDPKTAKVIKKTPLGNLELTNAFAFAFWGGDFYFFTETIAGIGNSKVTKLDYKGDGSLTVVESRTPLRVVGAGVSICAPLDEPPR